MVLGRKQPPPKEPAPTKASSPAKNGKDAIQQLGFKMKKISSPGRPGGENPVLIHLGPVENHCCQVWFAYRRPSTRSPFVEHFMYKAARDQEEWAQQIGLSSDLFFFHRNNEIQRHFPQSEYHIRCFTLEMAVDMNEEDLRNLAQYIKRHLNAKFDSQRGTSGHVVVPEDFDELVPHKLGVVSDFIGIDGAIRKIRRWLGADWNGDFEENKAYYRAFFHAGEIPRALQDFLQAPDSEIKQDG